jgi:hypothetical protein
MLLPLEEEVGQGNKKGYGYDIHLSDKPPDAPPPRRGGGPEILLKVVFNTINLNQTMQLYI